MLSYADDRETPSGQDNSINLCITLLHGRVMIEISLNDDNVHGQNNCRDKNKGHSEQFIWKYFNIMYALFQTVLDTLPY